MENDEYQNIILLAQSNFDWTIEKVIQRGYEDSEEEFDDYSILLEKYEFRKLVTFEIYENYFTPKRHEFDLQLITELVNVVAKHQELIYIGSAIASGVIGNTVYDLLRKLIGHIINKFSKIDKRRSRIFITLKDDIEKIEKYFSTKKKAYTEELEKELKIEMERLIPLLKLLGFKTKKKKIKKYGINQNNRMKYATKRKCAILS